MSNEKQMESQLDEEMIDIPRSRLEQLEYYERFLMVLQATGVENWEGYDDACFNMDFSLDS